MSVIRGRSSRSRWWISRRAVLLFAVAAAPTIVAPRTFAAQSARALPASLSDREFWDFFTTMSEDGGSFPSENFVSNEQTYQHVIPTLQRSLTPDGVYLGVGPEQNFTYIANLKPRMAVIFDIRRQNAMAHLMYKALFELSPTRADFVSRLFSRPLPSSIGKSSRAIDIFAEALVTKMSDSAFDANRQAILDLLTVKHRFGLTPTDIQSIKHVYASFFEAGPDINYAYRPDAPSLFRQTYATYAQIQTLTNAEGVNMAFLASEENYQTLRAMHMKNLIVPVVGNFAGPKAIRGVGEYLKQRKATVTAFYLSNVEQYLFRVTGDAEQFYQNVETLPLDSTSTFIRSVPPDNGLLGGTVSMLSAGRVIGPNNYYSVQVRDSAGLTIIQTTFDSAGRPITTRRIDSTSARRPSPLELFNALRARDDSIWRARSDSLARRASRDSLLGGLRMFRADTLLGIIGRGPIVVGNAGVLISGLAPIRSSLAAFRSGDLLTYKQVTAMTKVDGWK